MMSTTLGCIICDADPTHFANVWEALYCDSHRPESALAFPLGPSGERLGRPVGRALACPKCGVHRLIFSLAPRPGHGLRTVLRVCACGGEVVTPEADQRRLWTEDDEIERNGDKGAIRNLADELHRQQTERTADLHVMTQQGKVIEELREKLAKFELIASRDIDHQCTSISQYRVFLYETERQLMRSGRTVGELIEKLRVAEAVRDDARAASQRYLDEKRAAEAKAAMVGVHERNEEYWRTEYERAQVAMIAQADHYDELKANRDKTRAELLKLAKRIQVMTKHGRGGSGPCDANCLKCEADAVTIRAEIDRRMASERRAALPRGCTCTRCTG